ncbi:MAG: low molecular weight protein-tyrosine-phosphatase [Bacteroidia bacterium]
MNKILMVCLGNICRSPLAEGILRHKLVKAGILTVSVDSAGTADYHVGQAPDERSIANALRHQIDISKHRGRQFKLGDFSAYDHIYAMDASNLDHIISMANTDEDRSKVSLILTELYADKQTSVPDPYFGGEEGFEQVFQLLDKACDAVLTKITNSKN